MRAVIQRVKSAMVTVDGDEVGAIGPGLLALVGVADGDTEEDAIVLADKLAGLRIFPDGEGRMNLSVSDADGAVLVVSQFTLLADTGKGRRPSFTKAADPAAARGLIDLLTGELASSGLRVETGVFGARMEVTLLNDGPVTLVVDVVGGSVVSQ